MEFNTNLLSFAEISMHNKAKSCWVIINAKAYDVTNFLSDHPGGEEVLLAVAGKDGSEEFEKAGHGSASRLMLDEFYVGEVDPTTIPKTSIINLTTKQPQNINYDAINPTKLLIILLSLALLVVAIEFPPIYQAWIKVDGRLYF